MKELLRGIIASLAIATALVALLSPNPSESQPVSAQMVSRRPGENVVLLEQSCETSSTALVAAAQMVNTKRITFRNNGATNFVNICPTSGTCTAGTGFKLTVNKSLTIENALNQPFTCIANSAAVTVEALIERENAYPATPTPSPSPSPSPTPTPTPT